MNFASFENDDYKKEEKSIKKKKSDLIDFVADQFKQLSKRKLRIPIKLFHL